MVTRLSPRSCGARARARLAGRRFHELTNPETRLSGTLRKKLLAERLELEVKGTYAIERQAWFVFPRASYLVRDDLRLRLGYLAIGGPRASILGQFRDNDEFVLQARYSF